MTEAISMTPAELLREGINPALDLLAKVAGIPQSNEARVLMLAIAGQESAWHYRQQIGGPAHSFWQFELGGGVWGVINHASTRDKIRAVCEALSVPCNADAIYKAMTDENDVLDACMARLLLWTDPHALPKIGEYVQSWNYYERNWRPGMPHPETWRARYDTAVATVLAS